MYCKVCNKEVGAPEDKVCPLCGNQIMEEGVQFSQEVVQHKPINQTPYLVFAILSTVLCCIPLGVPAIVFASQINSTQVSGNYEKAENCAKKAKIFTIVAAIVGVLFIVGYFMLVFLGVAAGFNSDAYYY